MAKLREVRVQAADRPFDLVMADPASLDDNPLNWKIHTEFQSEVVGELIRKHGWIKPLVYNRTTGRLIDGHDRRKIALARGDAAVPVVVGAWPEDQEPEIIATLDPSGALAKSDPARLDAVMRGFRDPAPVIQALADRMAESEGVLAWLARNQPPAPEPSFVADPGDEGDDEGDPDDDEGEPAGSLWPAPAPSASHVRMVQLFLDLETFPEFRRMVDDLGELYDTSSDTDTVMACLRETHQTRVVQDPR